MNTTSKQTKFESEYEKSLKRRIDAAWNAGDTDECAMLTALLEHHQRNSDLTPEEEDAMLTYKHFTNEP